MRNCIQRAYSHEILLRILISCLLYMLIVGIIVPVNAEEERSKANLLENNVINTFDLQLKRDIESFDMSVMVSCIQGILNRQGPVLYVLTPDRSFNRPPYDYVEAWVRSDDPTYWWNVFRKEDGWLHGKEEVKISGINELVKFAGNKLKGAVIWDPEVPATLNVATTIAGVEDCAVLSPELADKYLKEWNLPVIQDLRGKFTGRYTGSKKNDAYRWAFRKYYLKGLCSSRYLAWYPDSFVAREKGAWDYAICRDWAVKNRCFVFHMWPWADEPAADEPEQPSGTDYRTLKTILGEVKRQANGKHMTELAGFFAFHDGPMFSNRLVTRHTDGVYTEWETVWQISRYNVYQNTACAIPNQSFHSHYRISELKQNRPAQKAELSNKTYLVILMADYDSTGPVYNVMNKCWDDPARGSLPLAWGVNPNMVDALPDIVSYFYKTATKNDFFVSDASCAGYVNPNRIPKESIPLFTRHNKYYFDLLDMSIAGMVLDFDAPSSRVKDAFMQFAPDGYACITWDQHGTGGKAPEPHVWKNIMPVLEHAGGISSLEAPEAASEALSRSLKQKSQDQPYFHWIRTVWTLPGNIAKTIELLKQKRPELDIEVVDPYTFFELFKKHKSGG